MKLGLANRPLLTSIFNRREIGLCARGRGLISKLRQLEISRSWHRSYEMGQDGGQHSLWKHLGFSFMNTSVCFPALSGSKNL